MTSLSGKQKAALTAPVVYDTAQNMALKLLQSFVPSYEKAVQGMGREEACATGAAATVFFAGAVLGLLMVRYEGFGNSMPTVLEMMREEAIAVYKDARAKNEDNDADDRI